ncbi:MAG: DUF2029 domain-containing protein [Deltaproteobacteria bacterium]|nr:DUF2029 domain-containing protein [Candidatus Anaeroferrophillacea bacterium]
MLRTGEITRATCRRLPVAVDTWLPPLLTLAGLLAVALPGQVFTAGRWGCGYGLMALGYLYLWRRLPAMSRRGVALVALLFLLLRLWLTSREPLLSDDIYRCLWEGRVWNAGFDPYRLAPDHPALAVLRNHWHALINHPELPAIYPPLQLAVNSVLANLHESPGFYKLALTVADIVVALLLGLLLARRGRSQRCALLYFTHPLAVLEVSWSGHHDPVFLAFLLAALMLLDDRRRFAAGLAWGAAVATRFVPLVLVREFRHRRSTAGFLVVILACYLPFWLAGSSALGSLGAYAADWEFNGSLYRLGTIVIADHRLVRLVLFGLFGGWWAAVNLKTGDREWRVLLLFVGVLAASPTVHPWYGLWVLPLAVLLPGAAPAVWFALLLPLSYVVLEGWLGAGLWHEVNPVTAVIYLPLMCWPLVYRFARFSGVACRRGG